MFYESLSFNLAIESLVYLKLLISQLVFNELFLVHQSQLLCFYYCKKKTYILKIKNIDNIKFYAFLAASITLILQT